MRTNVRILSAHGRSDRCEKECGALKYDYVKAILYAYPALGEIGEAVGAAADNKALLSYRDLRSTEKVAGEIVKEICVRRTIEELCSVVEEMLGDCSEEETFLLEYKYFRRKRVLREKFSSFALGCTERNYFRKQNRLFLKAAGYFTRKGWTQEKFLAETDGLFSRVMAALGDGREYALTAQRRRGRPCQSSG